MSTQTKKPQSIKRQMLQHTTCIICRRTLQVGEQYENIGMPCEGIWEQFRSHVECYEVFSNKRPKEEERRKRYEDQKAQIVAEHISKNTTND